ncbi:MAG: cell division protein FtsI/penicillin-binding protein 2 [Bradymonadia bacterium]|jgi:cell division protein FtsI/penicillin-binding protein 2
MATSEKQTLGRITAALAAAGSVLLAATVIFSQSRPDREVIYGPPVTAPGAAVQQDAVPALSPLEIRSSVGEAMAVVAAGVINANAEVPEVPWNEYGLARVPILWEDVRLDSERDRYVVDLDGGRVAILTLRPYIQNRLTELVGRFDEPSEAVVSIDPTTGRVLALVDDFSDEALGAGGSRSSGAFAASTFKVITGAALLSAGVADPDTSVCFSGGSSGFEIGDLTPNAERDDQCLTLTDAMAWSANLVFARLADRHLTPEALQEMANAFGFNARIPFEMELDRSRATIPSDRLGFTRAAAGFYSSWMSPLHGALIQAAIINGGRMMVPTIVERIEDAAGVVVYEHQPYVWREPISASVAEALSEVQSETCRSGTARADFGQRDGWPGRVRVFGKTGTLSNRDPGSEEDPDPLYMYRWFTGHAVHEEQTIAVAALVINTPRWWIKGTYLASEAVLASLL